MEPVINLETKYGLLNTVKGLYLPNEESPLLHILLMVWTKVDINEMLYSSLGIIIRKNDLCQDLGMFVYFILCSITCVGASEAMVKSEVTVMPHTPYSSDLASCAFFPRRKQFLSCRQYNSDRPLAQQTVSPPEVYLNQHIMMHFTNRFWD
jgi:hypothetical protein